MQFHVTWLCVQISIFHYAQCAVCSRVYNYYEVRHVKVLTAMYPCILYYWSNYDLQNHNISHVVFKKYLVLHNNNKFSESTWRRPILSNVSIENRSSQKIVISCFNFLSNYIFHRCFAFFITLSQNSQWDITLGVRESVNVKTFLG